MRFSSKKSFTIVEVLIIIWVLSVGLLSILSVLRRGFSYVQESRQKIIALDLAREGIEAVYQIRNTNRKRWSAQKEQCWLKADPLVDTSPVGCDSDDWMQSGSYILDTSFVGNQRYFLLTGWTKTGINLSDGVSTTDLVFRLCLSSGSRFACPGSTWSTPEGMYFREIHGYGLFIKDVPFSWWFYATGCASGGTNWIDATAASQSCWSSRAKEYVFCSRVVYGPLPNQEISLCGSITNFAADTL